LKAVVESQIPPVLD